MANIQKDKLEALKNEIIMSEAINREDLQPIIQESVQRYTGQWWPAIGTNWDVVLNEVYPVVQTLLPSIFFRNPRAFLKPKQKTYLSRERDVFTGKYKTVQRDSSKSATTQEALLNYSLTEMKYKREVRKVLLDSLISPYGVLWHGYKGDFGMTEEQSIDIKNEQIFVSRISPLRFIYDPAVSISTIDEARWVGRIIDVPLNDLLDDDKLDIDNKQIKGVNGFGNIIGTRGVGRDTSGSLQGTDLLKPTAGKPRSLLDFTTSDFKRSALAKFVRVYEIFMRPTKKEAREGKPGKIILLTDEQDKPLRVNEWLIKAEGFPIKILEFNSLNDYQFGINDIDTYKQIADQKNAIVNLQLRNAKENSKVYVAVAKGEMGQEEDLQRIQSGDQTILLWNGDSVAGKMSVASAGGSASSELYLIDTRIQQNLERTTGINDLKQGVLRSGEESATSVRLRNAASAARPAYRQDLMADFLKDSFLYINQLIKQFVPFKEAVRIIGSLDLEWSDDFTKEEIQAEVDVDIDVYSMLPEDPAKELASLQQVLGLMIQAINDPGVKSKLAQEGKTIELSPIIEQMLLRLKLNNPNIFRNIRPDESEGFVSAQQLRQAEENVQSALMGGGIPNPPTPEDDHRVKLTIYTQVQSLLQQLGQVSDVLDALVQSQTAMAQQMQEKQSIPGQTIRLNKPSSTTI